MFSAQLVSNVVILSAVFLKSVETITFLGEERKLSALKEKIPSQPLIYELIKIHD